ncbi:TylF/MycF/NovP-related O-methyltransferase [Halanaerobium praevalens]|uniref:dTDP-6-deoxy-L-hexose 3-O-methyltransferase n=1 Tax=Halanaerobium praevalens (strain ATCC 33744 / DSM 2228 / GSL) TaxID=572479 RepID=E3DR05_HALPG|nr:TylF/MycF/NovP-related O-methyltransferase [Halanaerobium praevalens]ADO77994.1 dTDP-6-deoxy-L-hexose 3-O-methyltransferase [Halanaerobium praevalens DSM 2228]
MNRIFDFNLDKSYEYENGFYLTSKVERLAKLISHYELYKSIIDLPGNIVECGVFKGASLIRFSSFREMLENYYSRKIIGFDIFGEFPRPNKASENDIEFIEKFENNAGNGISVEELDKILKHKNFRNYELVKGDIIKTIPEYLIKNPELKISLLHIDVDVYQPTKFVLENLFDKVVKNGLIVLDDYGKVAGATKAVDEFLDKKEVNKVIKKHSISHVPAYIRK